MRLFVFEEAMGLVRHTAESHNKDITKQILDKQNVFT